VTDIASSSPATLSARNNSFGFARCVAAAGVIFSHHFPISGYAEPRISGFTVGAISLYVFFLTSGYLICKSILGNPDFYRFVSARILRIIPNLFVVLALTSVTTLVYYSNSDHWMLHLRYIAQNLFMLVRGGPYYEIAGVFEERPLQALNGSLWSLPYEVWCYFLLFGILTLSAGAKRHVVVGALLICILIYWLPDVRLYPLALSSMHFAVLGAWFFTGATLSVFSLRIPLLSSPRMAWFARWGDPSYGMYILAWPVQQFCAAHINGFWTSMAGAMLIVTAFGYATWHGFERTAVGKADILAAWFRTKVSRRQR
jgi:peptidoglycan/LPS O-acetylase OafA/YrhL